MDRMVAAAVARLQECESQSADVGDIARRIGVDIDAARSVFPTDAVLAEAVDTYGIVQLADAITQALVAAPPEDNRAALIALFTAYLNWARENPKLYSTLLIRTLQSTDHSSILRRYDASFVPLVRRYLGETEGVPPTRRATFVRALLLGLGHLAADGHLWLWTPPHEDAEAELSATVIDFVDMLLAAGPAQPIRSEA